MSVVTWGTLAKTVDDKETIEDYVSSKLNEHNEDYSAHSQANEPIYNHRNADVLDHLDDSVTFEKVDGTVLGPRYVVSTQFESLDGFDFTPLAVTHKVGILTISADDNEVDNHADIENELVDWAKDPYFQSTFFLEELTSQIAYIGIGDGQAGLPFVGFKIVNGSIYACWVDNSNVEHLSSAISGYTLTDKITIGAYYDYGTDVKFYVNRVLKHTADTDLPTDSPDRLCHQSLTVTSVNERMLYILYFLFVQKF